MGVGMRVIVVPAFSRRGLACQPAVANHNDSYVIESLLEAAGVPGGSLDSPLKPEAQPGDGGWALCSGDHYLSTCVPSVFCCCCQLYAIGADDYGLTYRASGIMLVVEIQYEGEVNIQYVTHMFAAHCQ